MDRADIGIAWIPIEDVDRIESSSWRIGMPMSDPDRGEDVRESRRED
jgi:hypothetical protein